MEQPSSRDVRRSPAGEARPLTPAERAQLGLILAHRARQAWIMTGLCVLLVALAFLRLFAGRTPSKDLPFLYGFAVFLFAAIAAIVWFLGWGLVRQLRADLEDGRAATLEGTVKKLLRVNNVYGDTITTADIGDTRVLTRADLFDATKEGDRVRVLLSPRAKVALAVTPLALALLLLGAGCSVGFFPSPITPGAPATADPEVKRADFLRLARLRWMRGEEQAVLLTERGELVDQGTFIGTLRRDGTFTTRDRKRTLSMEPDGTIHADAGRQIQIAEDGTATIRVHGQPDETVTQAHLAKPQAGRPGLTLEGGSPDLARTSMWILMIPDLLRISPDGSD